MCPPEPTADEIWSAADEMVAFWMRRRVSMEDAAISLGRLPPKNWNQLRLIVAQELLRALIKSEKNGRVRENHPRHG